MEQSRNLRFRIDELCCAEEATALRRVVGPVVGGEDRLAFDLLNRRMTVAAHDPALTEAIQAAVASVGMRAEIWQEEARSPDAVVYSARGLWWTAGSGGLLGLGLLCELAMAWQVTEGGLVETLRRFCLLGALLCGMRLVAPKALRAAIRLQPDMNLLMTVAVIGAVVIGEYSEAASVAFLFALSNALEAWSIRRAQRAISNLLDLTPPTARILRPDGEIVVPIAEVPVSSHVIVKPGERIPLDGTVLQGLSEVNQAPITGESIPVGKSPGDQVFAGTVNGRGALEIVTTKAAGDSTVAHISRLVDEAQSSRSPSEQWVERFARIYTPAVMLVAFFVFVVPPLVLGEPWSLWFYRSLVLLVIACPCALVISTPVCIVSGLAAAARQGILVKGGIPLEAAGRLNAIAFDKTGTLTEGRPRVQTLIPLNGHTEAELLERAAALEARSDHPLAQAIVEHAASRAISIHPADDYQEIPGKGASGRWRGEPYWLGSTRLLTERNQGTPEVQQRLRDLAASGQTVVVIGNERHVCGVLALADSVRPSAPKAIRALRAAGVTQLTMLTGDNRPTGEAIARLLDLNDVRAELLPGEKVEAVRDLVSTFKNVGMVGDGINDAPALATANVGIAMGVAGSDAAIETADIALMSNDLMKLVTLIELSRRTMRTIQGNIAFALGVKLLFLALTLAGQATLWAAVAADMGASLLVILNGIRLLNQGYDSAETNDPDPGRVVTGI